MEIKTQTYFAKIASFNEEGKYVDIIILHFDKANENYWRPVAGCLDAFLTRLSRAKKFIPACYQHDETNLIGQVRDIEIVGDVLKGRMYLDDIPFVREVVIPQLKSGTLQGSSPTLAPVRESYNQDAGGIWDILEGVLCEVSLVGLPADLKADIVSVKASIEAKRNEDFDFELLNI